MILRKNLNQKKNYKWILSLTNFLVFSQLLLTGCFRENLGDLDYQEMSLEEAQELLLFDVCLPLVIPEGLHQETLVGYQADFGDPQEGNITINFLNDENGTKVFSITEHFVPKELMRPPDNQEFDRINLRRDLLAWMVGWEDVWNLRFKVSDSYKVLRMDNGIDDHSL